MVVETGWLCEICKKHFNNRESAQECEDGHVKLDDIKIYSLYYHYQGKFPAKIVILAKEKRLTYELNSKNDL